MGKRCTSNFKVISWEPQPYDEPEKGATLYRTDLKKVFSGALEAESTVCMLSCESEDGKGYVATERITGRLGERFGSFVVQHGGAMEGDKLVETFGYIVPGSGTDELRGLKGRCSFEHTEQAALFHLDYEFEA
uniref:DUF3224 domain-containing protein n=1 Tax=Thermosporothrix sp. COM3 TaxID=2490863 RepID=A0A455SKB2_9CHLR|nr:hypothetical protein KTC_02350 [Thermosporothrix sp. COM3]